MIVFKVSELKEKKLHMIRELKINPFVHDKKKNLEISKGAKKYVNIEPKEYLKIINESNLPNEIKEFENENVRMLGGL